MEPAGVDMNHGQVIGRVAAHQCCRPGHPGLPGRNWRPSVLVGVRLTARTEPAAWPRSVTLVLAGELGLLLTLLAVWEIAGARPEALALDLLIALSAGAMGMQTAAVRRLGVAGVTTTFVTGMLTGLIAELAAVTPGRSHWTLWAGTLASMVIGAAAGAGLFLAWRSGAPLAALGLVATVIAAAAWQKR